MAAFDGLRIIGYFFKAIAVLCKFAYKTGLIGVLLAIVLTALKIGNPTLWLILGILYFVMHWTDFIFQRTSLTGEKHLIVYLVKKLLHKDTDVKGVMSEKLKNGDKIPSGIILGRENGTYIQQTVEEPGSIAVFGEAGSGKSQLIESTLVSYGAEEIGKSLEEQPSMCVVDVKGELLQSCYKYRSETMRRPIKYLSFGDRFIDEVAPSKYDPYCVFEWAENPIQAANEISNALIPMRADEKQPFFPQEARTMLTGIIYGLYKKGYNFGDTIKKICATPISEVIDLAMEDEKSKMLLQAFSEKAKMPNNNEFSSVLSTMLNPLRLLATNDNIIDALTVDYSYNAISPKDLAQGDTFLCIREQYLEKNQPNILNLIISQYLSYFSRNENDTAKRVLFILDEYPRLGQLPVIDGINLYRSKGLRFMIASQSMSQIKDTYGDNGMNNLADGCAKMVILSAKGEAAKYFSERVGRYEKTMKSTSVGQSSQSMSVTNGVNSGVSISEQERLVFQPSYFETQLASQKKCLILSNDGYKEADICMKYNDRILCYR